MEIKISHPIASGNKVERWNFSRVDLGSLSIWFSYKTPIGFIGAGESLTVRENDWSVTTGKHLNSIEPDKSKRISGHLFEAKLEEILKRLELRDK